jgi:hypothetical protein
MKTIEVEITGTTPLLMNSPKSMLDKKAFVTNTNQKSTYEDDAEKVAYKNDAGNLFVPCQAIKGSMINASSFKKIGKFAAKSIIASGVRIIPLEIEILDLKGKIIKDYEIDLRTVVVQRTNRVVKARPKINKWKLQFEMLYNEKLIAETAIISTILEDAGERVGILDFRPQHNGDFGCFQITKFKVK